MNRLSQNQGFPFPSSLWYSGLHTLGTNVIMILLGITVSILIARLLGPEGKGEYSLVFTTAGLLEMFLGLSLPSGIIYVVARQKKVYRAVLFRLFLIALLEGIFAFIVVQVLNLGGYSNLFFPARIRDQIMITVGFSLVFGALLSYWRAILVGLKEIFRSNVCELISRTLLVVALSAMAVFSVLYGSNLSAIHAIWATVAVSMIANLVFLYSLWPKLSKGSGFGSLNEMLPFSLSCYFGNVAQFLSYRVDIFFVNFFVGAQGVGLYTLAVSVAQLTWVISNSFAAILFPNVASSQMTCRENTLLTAQITRVSLGLSFLSGLFLFLLANYMVPWLYGEAFRKSVTPLLWMLPGVVAFSLVNVLASHIAGMGKPRINLFISLVGLLITLILNFFLTPWLNIAGAAIASTVSYSASAVLTIWLFLRRTDLHLRDILLVKSEDVSLVLTLMGRLDQCFRFQSAGCGWK